MKLGVFAVLFAQKSFEEMLDYVKQQGYKQLKLGQVEILEMRIVM